MFGNELQIRKEERNPKTEIKEKKKWCRVEKKIKANEMKNIVFVVIANTLLFFYVLRRRALHTFKVK